MPPRPLAPSPHQQSAIDTEPSTCSDATGLACRLAGEQGFTLAGVAPADPSAHARGYHAWLDAGHHGQMTYLETTRDVRPDPRKLQPGAVSVICVADLYPSTQNPSAQTPPPPDADANPRGRFARYGWGRDYHKTIKKRLHAVADALSERFSEASFRCTTDTAPLFEREYAALAGLGWIGRHTLTLNPSVGSWMLLGCIVTDLPMQPTSGTPQAVALGHGPLFQARPGYDHCGTCTACIDACPTEAINPQRREVIATRCISYLTLEHRDTIQPQLQPLMQDWIGGCDICQDVCPHNQRPVDAEHPKVHPDYAPRPHSRGLDLFDVLTWTDKDRAKHLAGSALMRIKLPMLIRNALIALGNQPDAKQNPRIRRAVEDGLHHPEPLVQRTARQVHERLRAAPETTGGDA